MAKLAVVRLCPGGRTLRQLRHTLIPVRQGGGRTTVRYRISLSEVPSPRRHFARRAPDAVRMPRSPPRVFLPREGLSAHHITKAHAHRPCCTDLARLGASLRNGGQKALLPGLNLCTATTSTMAQNDSGGRYDDPAHHSAAHTDGSHACMAGAQCLWHQVA